MGFRLEDRWVWDHWTAVTGGACHLFFLWAPRSLGDPDLRHHHARIGHAVSTDLSTWEVLPDPFPTGQPGAWDDLATWTGSVIEHAGTWFLFYTGISTQDDGHVQRIGLATSPDLTTWEKVGADPIIEPDPTWYEPFDPAAWHERAWRDPWVFRDDATGIFHALITARRRHGPPDARGVLAHATSPDLRHWDVGPPIDGPAGFGHLEVPQVLPVHDGALLVFCVGAGHLSAERAADGRAASGTYVVRGRGLLGPFSVPESTPLVPITTLYAGRVLTFAGRDWLLGFIDRVDGAFVGEIADPVPFDRATADSASGAPPAG